MDNTRLPVMLTAVVVTVGLTAGIAGLVIGGGDFVVNVLSSVLTASIALLFLSPLFAWLRAAEHYRDQYQRWRNAHVAVRFVLEPVRRVVEARGNEDVTVPDGWSFDTADRHLMELASYFRARKRRETPQRPQVAPFDRDEALAYVGAAIRMVQRVLEASPNEDLEALLAGVTAEFDAVGAAEAVVRAANDETRSLLIASAELLNFGQLSGAIVERLLAESESELLDFALPHAASVANLYSHWSSLLSGISTVVVRSIRLPGPNRPQFHLAWWRALD